ncbi:hypothetical protein I551_3041 [Mycobacterium ulcerans str. Harvey]|uniref:Uncharacterized protein n=1 Tax=Mycobacterium ulcerans str. Harvey TaxID=1299332 RepID=A0ABP3AH04_MYCUL|nr:hypothetical protein I551_3041 [Mycobacterium ulcerans str. Harvey]
MMIFGAALLGPECRHGLSGERSSWLLFVVVWSCPCLAFQYCLCRRFQRCSTAGVL